MRVMMTPPKSLVSASIKMVGILLVAALVTIALVSFPTFDYKGNRQTLAVLQRHYKEVKSPACLYMDVDSDSDAVSAVVYQETITHGRASYNWSKETWSEVAGEWTITDRHPPDPTTIHAVIGDNLYKKGLAPALMAGLSSAPAYAVAPNRRGIWRWRTPLTDWGFTKITERTR